MMRNYCLTPVIFLCAAEWVKFPFCPNWPVEVSVSPGIPLTVQTILPSASMMNDMTSSVLSSSLYIQNESLAVAGWDTEEPHENHAFRTETCRLSSPAHTRSRPHAFQPDDTPPNANRFSESNLRHMSRGRSGRMLESMSRAMSVFSPEEIARL